VTNGVTTPGGPVKARRNDPRRRPLSSQELGFLDQVVVAVLKPSGVRVAALGEVLDTAPPNASTLLERAIFRVAFHHRIAGRKTDANFKDLEIRFRTAVPGGFSDRAREIVEDLLRGQTPYATLPALALVLGGSLLLANYPNPTEAWNEIRNGIVVIVDWRLRQRTRGGYRDADLERNLRAERIERDLGLSPEPAGGADTWEVRRTLDPEEEWW